MGYPVGVSSYLALFQHERQQSYYQKNNPIAKALKLPRDAEFHRCALQVNPYSYGSRFRGQPSRNDAETRAKVIVEKAWKLVFPFSP